jgi:predicted membrane GTPase involved in stress response
MPQTRFVTQKALELGLRPILVVNKVDKENCRFCLSRWLANVVNKLKKKNAPTRLALCSASKNATFVLIEVQLLGPASLGKNAL